MRLVYSEAHTAWVIQYGGQTVAIGGTTFFPDKQDALDEIAKRGLAVTSDGDIVKQEAVVPAQHTAPLVENHDPLETLEADEPAEDVQEPAVAPVEAEEAPTPQEDVVEALEAIEPDIVDVLDDLSGPQEGEEEAVRTETTQERAARQQAERAAAEHNGEAPPKRRRAQNRAYYHQRAEARRREVAERSRQWWEEHPEKVSEYRKKANATRRERYANDPEYRAKVTAANKAYQERRKQQRGSA